MALRRGLVPAIAIAIAAMTDAFAQFAPPLPKSPCYDDVIPLWEEVQSRIRAISAAEKRKVPSNEVCQLYGRLFDATVKMSQFVDNATWCGFQPTLIEATKTFRANISEIGKRACVAPPPPPKRMRIAAFSPDFAGW
jgi:hypothetical protein